MNSLLHAVPMPAQGAHPLAREGPAAGRALPGDEPAGASTWRPGPWFRLILDAIDYGVALIQPDGGLLYANAAMSELLEGDGPLRLDAANRLRAGLPEDDLRLAEARHAACSRGLRRLVQLGHPAGTVALVGVDGARPGGEQPCLLLANRPAACERLSLDLYARLHGLTEAENQVLSLLSGGHSPEGVAQLQGLRISTVRSHIGAIRGKTAERSLTRLMQRIATLPPIVGSLRRSG